MIAWQFIVAASTLLLTQCAYRHPVDSATRVVGGATADPKDLPGIVYIQGGYSACTAVKIADRHFMTAAHCVVDDTYGDLLPPYFSLSPYAKEFYLSRQAVITSSVPTAVENVWVHPSYWQKCKKRGNFGSCVEESDGDVADIAIFSVKGSTEDIPIATLNVDPLPADHELVIAGWGCEDYGPTDKPNGSRRLNSTPVRLVNDVSELTSDEQKDFFNKAKASYYLIPGKAINANNPGVCPGDSGGPFYLKTTQGLVVVGVNSALHTRLLAPNAPPDFSMVTRLDGKPEHHVAAWVKNVLSGKEPLRPQTPLLDKLARASRLPFTDKEQSQPLTLPIAQNIFVFRHPLAAPGCYIFSTEPYVKWKVYPLGKEQFPIHISDETGTKTKVPIGQGYYFLSFEPTGEQDRKETRFSFRFVQDISECFKDTGTGKPSSSPF